MLWFFSLEDLAASFVADHMKMQNEFFDNYTFLSDYEVPRNYPPANFCFLWNRFNEFRAKFFKGTVYPTHEGFQPPQKAWVQAVPFNYFQQHRWYQCAVTWDDSAKSASLFVNGVLLGKSDVFNKDFHRDRAGDALYAGCPALCHGQIEFYDRVLTGAELYKQYRAAAPDYDPAIEKELRHRFEGTELEEFTFKKETAGWTKQFDVDFQNPVEQIKEFYREMNDVRNDTGTAFSRKNPFAYRIGFGSAPAPFTINEWHKAQLVQHGGKIRGAIDGKVLLEIDDNPRTNTGCILNYGHIAIRCMVHTAMVFRSLKVFTEKLPFTELKS